MRLCHHVQSLPLPVDNYRTGRSGTRAEREKAKEIIAIWRQRLADLSWFMRSLNEDLARRANAEDSCKGRFWEGRFKSHALLDEAAVLTCMSYVDLNALRAGQADSSETSEFTSIQQRIVEYGEKQEKKEINRPRLTPFKSQKEDSHINAFSFTTEDYLTLVDWSGRTIREGKQGAIGSDLPPILKRLQLDRDHFLDRVGKGGWMRHVAALGRLDRLREVAERLGRRFLKGHGQSRLLYLQGS